VIVIVGIDPGETTGICVVTKSETERNVSIRSIASFNLSELDKGFEWLHRIKHLFGYTCLGAIESIVSSGRLNQEKINQIKVYDRFDNYFIKAGVPVIQVAPAITHSIVCPNVIANYDAHAKDAYRIAVLGGRIYDTRINISQHENRQAT
jgi:hypothetical protein